VEEMNLNYMVGIHKKFKSSVPETTRLGRGGKTAMSWGAHSEFSETRQSHILVHSVVMLLIQIIFLTYDTVNGIALFTGNLMLQTFVVNFFRWIQDLIIFGNSICLILIR
jgi:hypothetical protein